MPFLFLMCCKNYEQNVGPTWSKLSLYGPHGETYYMGSMCGHRIQTET